MASAAAAPAHSSHNFFDYKVYYPFLETLKQSSAKIRAEVLKTLQPGSSVVPVASPAAAVTGTGAGTAGAGIGAAAAAVGAAETASAPPAPAPSATTTLPLATWHDWPETSLYPEGQQWKVIPFCHSFTKDGSLAWVDASVKACPETAALLRSLPGLRTALFSRMGPGVNLVSHTGWAELANYVLRCHLGLIVPDEDCKPCGLVVDDEIQHHREGELLVFDDSKIHSAFNNHASKERIVLIFDLERPSSIPLGTAEGGATEQLQGMIDYFK